MARISGVDLPREKRIEIGLTYVYGIGLPSSQRILKEADVNPDTRVRDLTDDEVRKIQDVINETQIVEGDLRREIILSVFRRLAATGVFVTGRDFPFVVRRQRPTQEHVRVPRELLQTRRSNIRFLQTLYL